MELSELKPFFLKEIWSIYPQCPKNVSLDATYVELEYQISNFKNIDGTKLQPEEIRDKYKLYFDYIQKVNVDRESQYKSKPLTIYEWLVQQKYYEDLSNACKQPYEIYLYGN